MAARSQNGWTVVDAAGTELYTVSDSGKKLRLRKGPAGAMLADFFLWFDREVRDIDPGPLDDWGWAPVRPVRDGYDISNHASGTAGDVDATKWPLGFAPDRYLTQAEIALVRGRLKRYRGCLRWGGDYLGRKDPMHVEIDRDEAEVSRVWAELTRPPVPVPVPTPPRRRRMYLTRDNSNGKTYLWTDCGPRLLADQEEVDCLRGFLAAPAPVRDAKGVLQGGVLEHNARFHDVIAKVFARPVLPAGTV